MKILNSEVKMVDGTPKRVHKLLVHKFSLGDVEDPDLHAAEPLYKWEHSEQGQYVISKALETPMWHRQLNQQIFGYEYAITAKLYEEDVTYFTLRWL